MLTCEFRFAFPGDRAAAPLCFAHPQQVVAAHRLEDVLPALTEVQHAAERGAYAAGYVAYEAAPAFDAAMQINTAGFPPDFPLACFGIFAQPSPMSVAHSAKRVSNAAPGAYQPSESSITSSILHPAPGASDSNWQPTVSHAAYLRAVASIRSAIGRGDAYQVNYTMRLRALLMGEARAFCESLWIAQRPAYGAYLDLGRYQICSASPELFFHRRGDRIVTRPMKGTAPRSHNVEQDAQLREELACSEKNRAENVMIADLTRNDLGRIAQTGSVQVTRLFDVEPYPTVWQMTSTVEAALNAQAQSAGLPAIFTALFPCGSITGAPKISAMQHLARLETGARSIYCGAIGLVKPGGEAMFNVAIRTALCDAQTGQIEYGIGGGITWDSQAEDEYAEALSKAAILNYAAAANVAL